MSLYRRIIDICGLSRWSVLNIQSSVYDTISKKNLLTLAATFVLVWIGWVIIPGQYVPQFCLRRSDQSRYVIISFISEHPHLIKTSFQHMNRSSPLVCLFDTDEDGKNFLRSADNFLRIRLSANSKILGCCLGWLLGLRSRQDSGRDFDFRPRHKCCYMFFNADSYPSHCHNFTNKIFPFLLSTHYAKQ
jgi:hypothetical protein